MKKRFYLEINYDFYSDEEEQELKEIKNEIADVILDFTNVKSVDIFYVGKYVEA